MGAFQTWRLYSKQQTARKLFRTCGPSGGLVGIDQEVVTLRGLYGNSRAWTEDRRSTTDYVVSQSSIEALLDHGSYFILLTG